MNKKEMIEALVAGHKLTHRYFQKGEWVKQVGHDIVFEDGVRMSIKEFWAIREGGMAWDMDWEIFQEYDVSVEHSDDIVLQSDQMIADTYIYRDNFFFQRMTKDHKWYVTYKNRIIAHGQYRNDLTEWIDTVYFKNS